MIKFVPPHVVRYVPARSSQSLYGALDEKGLTSHRAKSIVDASVHACGLCRQIDDRSS